MIAPARLSRLGASKTVVESAVLGRQGPIVSDQGAALRLPHGKRDRSTARAQRAGEVVKGQPPGPRDTPTEGEWPALIFAAKTTAAALIALLVAFIFNLDEPYWALLTVLSFHNRWKAERSLRRAPADLDHRPPARLLLSADRLCGGV